MEIMNCIMKLAWHVEHIISMTGSVSDAKYSLEYIPQQ